jgi:TolA-binding protein
VPIVNNSRLQELENENQRLQGDINNLQNENQRLQGTIKELQDITNLAKSRSIVEKYTINQQAGHYSRWTVDVQYAGYIFVRIDSSTTNLAFARVSYTSNGGQSPHTITYEHRSNNLSSGNYVCFPVLPGTVFVDVGNSNAINGATHTVTIEYWY